MLSTPVARRVQLPQSGVEPVPATEHQPLDNQGQRNYLVLLQYLHCLLLISAPPTEHSSAVPKTQCAALPLQVPVLAAQTEETPAGYTTPATQLWATGNAVPGLTL